MSERNRKRKEANKSYREAGSLYWTHEMELMIVKIRRERKAFLIWAIVSTLIAFALGAVLIWQ